MNAPFPRFHNAGDAERLNQSCFCVTLDRSALRSALDRQVGEIVIPEQMFSDVAVFLSADALERMVATVEAVEALARLPAYRELALGRAPSIAQQNHGPRGAFMGYDFHVEGDVPRLIEVNTNAGGAALNASLLRAQRACCGEIESLIDFAPASFEQTVAEMFLGEWRAQRGDKTLRRIAIVDDAPATQFLQPEFVLIQRLLEQAGFETLVVDAAELVFTESVLTAQGKPVDLVYNRLVDFMLAEPAHEALRRAYDTGAAVVTPNPHLHALLADKRNLVLFSDRSFLPASGLSAAHREALSHVPETIMVTKERATELWASRRDWFFKPMAGHGGKAVYRGDKLTRGVFAQILEGGYVAQRFAAPGARAIRHDDTDTACKVDVRLYTYGGELLLLAGRLYQGQTTNFRTPGGGFAPIYVV